MLNPNHLKQNQIDGTEKIGVVPFGRRISRLNIKLPKTALLKNCVHEVHLTPKDVVFERIRPELVPIIMEAKAQREAGYDVIGTSYVKSDAPATKIEPSRFRKALHSLQLIEIV